VARLPLSLRKFMWIGVLPCVMCFAYTAMCSVALFLIAPLRFLECACYLCYVTLVFYLVCDFQQDRGAMSSGEATNACDMQDRGGSS
jgi:hypothetical protein